MDVAAQRGVDPAVVVRGVGLRPPRGRAGPRCPRFGDQFAQGPLGIGLVGQQRLPLQAPHREQGRTDPLVVLRPRHEGVVAVELRGDGPLLVRIAVEQGDHPVARGLPGVGRHGPHHGGTAGQGERRRRCFQHRVSLSLSGEARHLSGEAMT
ncbi:hypothetical protein [Streptomyces sp. NPDC088812]|uniref:hypothetical protein n=1 Tax=Streptomyces sp. NPDC088812 TaxID=3365905 RepID=UPI0037FBBA3E